MIAGLQTFAKVRALHDRTDTRAEAREAVLALLGDDLTDREIARRVGVSPLTVAAVRKQLA